MNEDESRVWAFMLFAVRTEREKKSSNQIMYAVGKTEKHTHESNRTVRVLYTMQAINIYSQMRTYRRATQPNRQS